MTETNFVYSLCFPQRGKLPPVRTLEGDEGERLPRTVSSDIAAFAAFSLTCQLC